MADEAPKEEAKNVEEPKKVRVVNKLEDSELRKVAMDILDGKIFTDRHLPPGDERMLASVFMVLIFAGDSLKDVAQDIGLIYEYIDKAGPGSVNGYPTFFSFRLLHKDNTVKMEEYYKQFKEAKDKMLNQG